MFTTMWSLNEFDVKYGLECDVRYWLEYDVLLTWMWCQTLNCDVKYWLDTVTIVYNFAFRHLILNTHQLSIDSFTAALRLMQVGALVSHTPYTHMHTYTCIIISTYFNGGIITKLKQYAFQLQFWTDMYIITYLIAVYSIYRYRYWTKILQSTLISLYCFVDFV
jgi:hypothetical protein